MTTGTAIAQKADGVTGQHLRSAVSKAFIHGVDIALLAAAGIVLVGTAVAGRLPPLVGPHR
jgi:hypothetical protein